MAWLPSPRQSQTARSPETDQPARARTGAPAEHDHSRTTDRASNVAPVIGPNRIGHAPQLARVASPKGEEVHHLDATEAPAPREADAATDRRIVLERIGGRRIQHHERDDRTRAIPSAPESIAIAPVRAERRSADHQRPYPRATRRASSAPRTNLSATTTNTMVAAMSSVESAARVGFWYCSR